MSHQIDLPAKAAVLRALAELSAESQAAGKRPSVAGLARRLGLSNTTFWRHYPEVAREVADKRRHHDADQPASPAGPWRQLKHRNAELRNANRTLNQQLDLAIAGIQRLTLDNHRLRQELETLTEVTRIENHRRSAVPSPDL